ncbi:MAG: PEPxxWA-CTERM sorting domain-containing protein [Sphingomonadaceae bacterium]
MHRFLPGLAALAAATALAAPGHAAHVSGGWYAWADAYGQHFQAPGVEGRVWIVNGVVQSAFASNGGSFEAGPLTPGATAVHARGTAPLGGEIADVTTSADLSTGTVRATAIVVDGGFPSMLASGSGRLRETLWFTNTTQDWLPIAYRVEMDGAISGFPVALGGQAFFDASAGFFVPESAGCTALAECIGFQPFAGGASGSAFRAEYRNVSGLSFVDPLGNAGFWTVTFNPGHDVDAGLFDFTMSTTLWVPPGETTVTLVPFLSFPGCGGQSGTCGFGNSGRIRLGDTPAGLSWRSESGVFLSALGGGGTPGIPEPATWALLIAGFGLVGGALRRRRTKAA